MCVSNAFGIAKVSTLYPSKFLESKLLIGSFDCPILFAFYIVGKVRYKWIGVCDVKLNTEN